MMRLALDSISHLQKTLRRKKLGVLCHAASINSKGHHLLSLLKEDSHFHLERIFAPEHGLWAVAQDMEGVEETQDSQTGVRVHSLYGSTLETLRPKKKWLEGLDAVVCDLQDVGSRYYTFVYSIAFVMQACREAGVPVFVLDRPNPIGGLQVEGNLIQPGFESFVGFYPIANRHGMTVGELSQMFNELFQIRADLTVLPMQGWQRSFYFDQTQLPWVLPSPNMPTLDTAVVYPGMCLVEATELSEGRGTTRPFEMIGAPFIDPHVLTDHLKEFRLPGVFFRPLFFKPTFQKFAKEVCGGVQLHVTDRKRFRPYLTGLALLKAIHDLYPRKFRWRAKPYEFVKDIPAIDLLTGSDHFRKSLKKGSSWKEIVSCHEEGKEKFLKQRKDYLMYR